MATLTPKQTRFCQLYVELGNASKAYRQSYHADNMSNSTIHRKASELLAMDKIKRQVDELQAGHRQRHDLTVDDLLAELEEARIAALTCETPQTSAAVSATMGKAKLLGLDRQVVDHTSSDGSMTVKPMVIELVAPNINPIDDPIDAVNSLKDESSD